MKVLQRVEGLEDDLLMADLLDSKSVEVVDGEAEEDAAVDVGRDEVGGVGSDAVIQTWNKKLKI